MILVLCLLKLSFPIFIRMLDTDIQWSSEIGHEFTLKNDFEKKKQKNTELSHDGVGLLY